MSHSEVLVLSCGSPQTHGALALTGLSLCLGCSLRSHSSPDKLLSLFRPQLRRDSQAFWTHLHPFPERSRSAGPVLYTPCPAPPVCTPGPPRWTLSLEAVAAVP